MRFLGKERGESRTDIFGSINQKFLLRTHRFLMAVLLTLLRERNTHTHAGVEEESERERERVHNGKLCL